jgi:hypothetical protein
MGRVVRGVQGFDWRALKLFAGGVFGCGVAVGLEGKLPAAQGIRIYGIEGLERHGLKINQKKVPCI